MIKLLHGDCLELMTDIDTNSIDMILCDLPYGVVNRKSNGLRNLDKGIADIITFSISDIFFSINRICKGSFYIFGSIQQISELQLLFIKNKISTRVLIWEKTNPSPMNGKHIWLSGIEYCIYGKKPKAVFNEHCKNTVFRFSSGRNKYHTTQKPTKLMERFITASTNENDTVLDICMGSGSTGVACINTNRKFIGIEKDEGYFKIAEERINKAIDEQA